MNKAVEGRSGTCGAWVWTRDKYLDWTFGAFLPEIIRYIYAGYFSTKTGKALKCGFPIDFAKTTFEFTFAIFGP